MMKPVGFCLGVTLALLSGGLHAGDRFAILEEAVAPRVLDQCSRAVPLGVVTYWRPSEQTIADVEAKLPVALLRAGHAAAAETFAAAPKQYIGLVREGKRFVYANVVTQQAATAIGLATAPIIVCDGGDAFFGVEVNVGTMAITHFATNGRG